MNCCAVEENWKVLFQSGEGGLIGDGAKNKVVVSVLYNVTGAGHLNAQRGVARLRATMTHQLKEEDDLLFGRLHGQDHHSARQVSELREGEARVCEELKIGETRPVIHAPNID